MKMGNITSWLLLVVIISLGSCATSKKAARRASRADVLIRSAKTYVGTPYRYGGLDKRGIDCSALIQNSYKEIGFRLPRTSKEQSKIGKKVSINSLKRGDLVFFKFKDKGNKWNHSGMVTRVVSKDEIYFIHSSSSRGVVESNLMTDYYLKGFKKARRIF